VRLNNRGLFANLKFFYVPRFRVMRGCGRGLDCRRGGGLNGPLTGTRLFEKGRPFVGQIDFLYSFFHRSSAHFLWLGGRFRNGSGRRGHWSGFCGDFGNRSVRRRQFGDFRGSRLCRGNGSRQFRVRQTSGALEAAAQFPEAFGTALVARFAVDLFQLRGEFGGTPVVACPKDKVEQFFEGGRVAGCAAEDGLKQPNGFLGEAVAGKQVDVSEGLGDKFLRIFVERRLAGRYCRLGWYFVRGFFLLGRQLGCGRFRNIRLQVLLGKLLWFSGRQ